MPGSQPEGTVIAENPSGGRGAGRRTDVRLNVSIGPGAGTATGMTTTSPAGGSQARTGSIVTTFVGRLP